MQGDPHNQSDRRLEAQSTEEVPPKIEEEQPTLPGRRFAVYIQQSTIKRKKYKTGEEDQMEVNQLREKLEQIQRVCPDIIKMLDERSKALKKIDQRKITLHSQLNQKIQQEIRAQEIECDLIISSIYGRILQIYKTFKQTILRFCSEKTMKQFKITEQKFKQIIDLKEQIQAQQYKTDFKIILEEGVSFLQKSLMLEKIQAIKTEYNNILASQEQQKQKLKTFEQFKLRLQNLQDYVQQNIGQEIGKQSYYVSIMEKKKSILDKLDKFCKKSEQFSQQLQQLSVQKKRLQLSKDKPYAQKISTLKKIIKKLQIVQNELQQRAKSKKL